MTGRTNVGGGSIGPLKKGTIGVKYPAGAICTVADGINTYTALDTSGAAAFAVDPGTWTITITQGENNVSETVTVAAGGWVGVELIFWSGELYSYGEEFTPITGGWAAYSGDMVKQTDNLEFSGASIAAQTINPVDVSNFSTMTIEVYAPGAALCYCGLSDVKQPPYALQSPAIPYRAEFNYQTEITTITIDISSASGLMYPTYMSYGDTSYLYSAKLT